MGLGFYSHLRTEMMTSVLFDPIIVHLADSLLVVLYQSWHLYACVTCPFQLILVDGGALLGLLKGGSRMLHVTFKKWQCSFSLSLLSPMSHFEFKTKDMSNVPISLTPIPSHIACRKYYVTFKKFKKCSYHLVGFRG